ncbi:serine/threonine-protein kinase STY46-like isoform X6 [Dioscorea cayenensis subsp. rotundata]|uniref:non-specific serine/threonine protein kinase n=1 Tax=Dioscorea cayennensis subsp. rotundata TaxID=55577 RepID=A0AB40BBV7_DIOCR|nr:serine/threonine-protein kinase STY46-like isoform X6 [Dioscorea cayenensis subsp. rotundata]
MEEALEDMGESSSPPKGFGPPGVFDIKYDIYARLLESRNEEELLNSDFREQFMAHFNRLPPSYLLDLNVDRAEDVLLHQKILTEAKDPEKRPVFHVRFIKLSALLSNIGLNIREAHVFSTTDGYSLDVFVVDGWPAQDANGLSKELEAAVARIEGSWSGSTHSSGADKILAMQPKIGDWEIDKRLLKMGEKIACGSCGDLYRGSYLGWDVAIKVLRSEHLDEASGVEFAQEVMILREVQHRNVVRFIGASTKPPQFCIVTEYMRGGSLYDLLHKHHNILELSMLLEFALDICKGMNYLHQNNVIHRDLKTANLLIDEHRVVKVADFGVARLQNQGGDMTAETGTYRWMAPEVINHQRYDQKADVFSFAVVLWELLTSKIPYDTLTPLQAALGVRQQGLRPELPENTHPILSDLIQRCWEADPAKRPSFAEIIVELEELLKQVKSPEETSDERRENANDD